MIGLGVVFVILTLQFVVHVRGFKPVPRSVQRLRSVSMVEINLEVESCSFSGRGCVLLAQPGEHDHFLHKSAVLVFEHNPKRGTQGVILGRPSAFSLGETAPNMPEALQPNTLFIGGQGGEDMALMFHKHELGGAAKYIGNGIYVGGLREAREALEERTVHPRDFKFIFNCVEWPPGAIENEIAEGRWDVVQLPPDMVLEQKGNKAESIWSAARNQVTSRLLNREVEVKAEAEGAE
jgi:putative AlgH/UPF0301 family transcriptional regulator